MCTCKVGLLLLLSTVTLAASVRVRTSQAWVTPFARNLARRTMVLQMSTEIGGTNADGHFDYIVIGGGSGGVASARRAASYGVRVALVEKKDLGGTCVNVGCVPKKVMYNAASTRELVRNAHHFGLGANRDVTVDWQALKKSRDEYTDMLSEVYREGLEKDNVEYIHGYARFTGPKSILINDKDTYTADHFLIASGCKPKALPIEGAEHTISSDDFFSLEQMPQKAAFVGAGYIAIEMAGILREFGSEVMIFDKADGPLSGFDSMLRKHLQDEMEKKGIVFHVKNAPTAVRKDEQTGKLTLETEKGETYHDFDMVLGAIGRGAASTELGLKEAGVESDKKGRVQVDDYQNTNVDGIYAVGDVCGRIPLTPMAIMAGKRLADRIFGGWKDAKADYENVPSVVFSHPPVATVGLTEEAAREKFGDDDIKVYTSEYTNLYYGPWKMVKEDKPKSAVKVVCQGDNQKVVGVHIIGMGADEMMQGFAVAVRMGATKADLDDTVGLHPTASEEVVTLKPWGLTNKEAGILRERVQM